MKTLYFKCTLLTDVVLNQKAATEGNQETLDFIPGNNFLGIAAGELYYDKNKPDRLGKDDSLKVFHSGKIRFGDAHPAEVVKNGENEERLKRSIRIPASYYKPKLNNQDGFYIYHEVKKHDDEKYLDFQPKQCRTGFYVFENKTLREVPVEKSFAIKSAYDRAKRRSADEKMFGYESLLSDSVWIFDVTMDDELFESEIKAALIGIRRIGRSRTAQYGLVKIEEVTEPDVYIEKMPDNPDFALVYADSRLIFLDEYGLPTFSPDAEQDLGFIGGKIDWKKTQIRTFQYAPWNAKRQARDTDRCGIEKGSVFYIARKDSESKLTYPQNTFVGKYLNEGFGKIIINPDFLKAKDGEIENGKALYSLYSLQKIKKDDKKKENEKPFDHPLYKYLENKKKETDKERMLYEKVNGFVGAESKKSVFVDESFASQWGTIRSIAMQAKNRTDFEAALFGMDGYLMHGVAKDKWEERGRLKKFKEFFDSVLAIQNFNDKDVRNVIINLAAEMAKISRRK
ncbi:MAG: hypothetical protein LBJ72_14255 [Dysgonamonadaceae bacterium]|nr:hypothetical protein [Dysgonamonadaceae bacterium]